MGFRGLVAMQFNKERKGTVKEELLACWFHYVDPEELIRSVREKTQDVAIQYLTKPWSKRDCIRAFETDQYGVPCFEAKDVSEDDISQFCMDISVCIRVDCRMEDYYQLKLREDGPPDMDICASISAHNCDTSLPFPELDYRETDRIFNYRWLHTDPMQLREEYQSVERRLDQVTEKLERKEWENKSLSRWNKRLIDALLQTPSGVEQLVKTQEEIGVDELEMRLAGRLALQKAGLKNIRDLCALSLPELTEALRSIVPDRAVNYAQQTEIALRKMGLHLRTA